LRLLWLHGRGWSGVCSLQILYYLLGDLFDEFGIQLIQVGQLVRYGRMLECVRHRIFDRLPLALLLRA
jgi:hypothetical protein